ncbi:MAG: hypothetical protein Q9226_002258 [Calogaya cf. arnoldii]
MDNLQSILEYFAAVPQAYRQMTLSEADYCQTMIEEFIVFIETNQLNNPSGREAIDQFVNMLDSNREDEEEGEDYTCLRYVLDKLNQRERLPIRNENHTLTTEQDLVRKRFYNNCNYIGNGGQYSEQHNAGYQEVLVSLRDQLKSITKSESNKKKRRQQIEQEERMKLATMREYQKHQLGNKVEDTEADEDEDIDADEDEEIDADKGNNTDVGEGSDVNTDKGKDILENTTLYDSDYQPV